MFTLVADYAGREWIGAIIGYILFLILWTDDNTPAKKSFKYPEPKSGERPDGAKVLQP